MWKDEFWQTALKLKHLYPDVLQQVVASLLVCVPEKTCVMMNRKGHGHVS